MERTLVWDSPWLDGVLVLGLVDDVIELTDDIIMVGVVGVEKFDVPLVMSASGISCNDTIRGRLILW